MWSGGVLCVPETVLFSMCVVSWLITSGIDKLYFVQSLARSWLSQFGAFSLFHIQLCDAKRFC